MEQPFNPCKGSFLKANYCYMVVCCAGFMMVVVHFSAFFSFHISQFSLSPGPEVIKKFLNSSGSAVAQW